MKSWGRALPAEPCGRCDTRQPAGEPVLIIELAGLAAGRRRIRCAACAGVPVDGLELEQADVRAEAAAADSHTVRALNQAALHAELQAIVPESVEDWNRRDGKLWGAGGFVNHEGVQSDGTDATSDTPAGADESAAGPSPAPAGAGAAGHGGPRDHAA